ncbi:hypothetical protein D3OALGA1CA_216 [Olavius algarvensis associated proteobacterium Delta 3]|nr:hypothetical protein D3OALGA1CA_216 [Olavius algarvensis associated proteobacterium Delta 3]
MQDKFKNKTQVPVSVQLELDFRLRTPSFDGTRWRMAERQTKPKMKKIQRISKSQYLKGVQCQKALWLYRRRPDLIPPVSETQQALFDMGHEIGNLAQDYFEGGVEITAPYNQTERAIEDTRKAIHDGNSIVFEATAASPDGAFSRIDIFRKKGASDTWDMIEVKGSTGVKNYHIDDIALQRFAFQGAGYTIEKSILMHVNNQYVRYGEIDVGQLFSLEDCTEVVRSRIEEVRPNLVQFLELLNKNQEPDIPTGGHCFSPFTCDFIGYCWQHVPEISVYDIFSGARLEGLLGQGILNIEDVPSEFGMTERQAIAVRSIRENRVHADIPAIGDFLDSLKYPLYFLDYETINLGVPLFDGTRPYQLVPFQFSLHVQEQKGGDLVHREFLHTDRTDPRPELAGVLVETCGNKGSVVVYNQSFESRVNRDLADAFPAYTGALLKINDRMVDLLVPFRSRSLYHPAMGGSASLKSVLPAFVPDMTYDDLAIQDGDMASVKYLKCIKGLVPETEKQEIFENLRVYCAQDTLAEVRLLEVMYQFG